MGCMHVTVYALCKVCVSANCSSAYVLFPLFGLFRPVGMSPHSRSAYFAICYPFAAICCVGAKQVPLPHAGPIQPQGLLEAVRKVRISAAAPGSAVDPDAAVAVLDAAQEYINGKKAAQAQNRNRSSSSWSDAGSNEESGGGSGGTGVRDPFDVARQLLKALGTKEQKQREQLERELLAQGAASMLVLSAMQPPKLSSAAAAERGGISGSSSGNVANVANVAAAEAAISEPATQLELNGLAVRLKKGTLRVMMLETKSGRAGETSCVQQCIVHNVCLVCPPCSNLATVYHAFLLLIVTRLLVDVAWS